MSDEVTEEDIQRAYMDIAHEEMLTVMPVPGDPSRAFVPGHWREAAATRALVIRSGDS